MIIITNIVIFFQNMCYNEFIQIMKKGYMTGVMGMKIGSMLLIAAGFILLGMGAVGLFLPIWPTTPFVLGAAGCFSGSPRLRAMIMKVGFFREHIENYQERQGLSKKVVVKSLVFLWGMLCISGFMIQALWATVLFLFIGTAVTVHILYMARKRNGKDES